MKKRKVRFKKRVNVIYLDPHRGLIFVTDDNKEHGLKYYHDASGAICDITIEEVD